MDLLDLITRETGAIYKRKTLSGEHCGPCPWCGGDDRFNIWVGDDPRYWCRGCGRKGDAIQFLRDFDNLPFAQAKEGAALLGLADARRHSPAAPKTAGDAPTGMWAERAAAFLTACQAALWRTGDDGVNVHPRVWDYLARRKLEPATVNWAGLGYNPADRYEDRERWGLPPEMGNQGWPKRVWLPRGLVIPWQLDGELWGLRIRRPTKPGDDVRYRAVPTPNPAEPLYLADQVRTDRPAMLVEGELDALTIWQTAGDLVVPVATGAKDRARRVRWLARLATVTALLVAFDADTGGDDGAAYWLAALPHARRWRPYWGDVNDMARAGADVRAWVLAGLANAPNGHPTRT